MELILVFTNVLFVHGFVSKEHFAVLFPFTQSIAANGVKAIIPVSVEFLFCEPTASLALTGAATVRWINRKSTTHFAQRQKKTESRQLGLLRPQCKCK